MKKLAVFALLVLMLLSLTACISDQETSNPQFQAVEPELKENVYQIREPGHLLYLAQHPDKQYALANDIDMQGWKWTPVDDFSGSLNGLIAQEFNFTISNMEIEVKEGDTNVGLFRTISGTVTHLNLKNITINCPGTFTGNLGVLAGVAKTALEDVEVKNSTVTASVKDANVGLLVGKAEKDLTAGYAAGDLKVTLSGGTSYVGGGVGYAAGALLSTEIRTNVTVDGKGTAGAAGGMAGYAKGVITKGYYIGHLKVNADATYAAGVFAGDAQANISNSYQCARSVTVSGGATQEDQFCGRKASGVTVQDCLIRDNTNIEDTLSEAERAMRQKVVDYAYNYVTYWWTPSQDMVYKDTCSTTHYQSYKAGTYYFGPPYTHDNHYYLNFVSYMDDNHVLSTSVPATVAGVKMLGNDCADMVYQAWSQVEADLTFTFTENAICNNGTLAVGGYRVTSIQKTADICAANGSQVMFEAYAKAQMGDALLYGPGHFRLVAEAAYVFRDANGKIDPNKSYIVTHEQGAGTGSLDQRQSTCKANGKYTFAELFASNYIPLTIEAYSKGEPDKVEFTFDGNKEGREGIGTGTINSNFMIEEITVRVTDSKGNVVANLVDHGEAATIRKFYALSRMPGVKDIALESGKEYTYEVFAEAAGERVCVRSYKFKA